MKIGRNNTHTAVRLARAGSLLLALLLGVWMGSQGTFPGGMAVLNPAGYGFGGNAGTPPPILALDISFDSYNTLLTQTQTAREQGYFIAGDDDFQTATAALGNQTADLRLRRPSGLSPSNPAVRLEALVRTGRLAEMTAFHLEPAAAAHDVYELLFRAAARREGLPTAPLRLVRLRINGTDYGPYFMHGRLPQADAVTVGWDGSAVWALPAAYGGDVAAVAANPLAPVDLFQPTHYAVEPEPSAAVDQAGQQNDSEARYETAVSLLQAQTFNAAQYGTYLALCDWWGAFTGLRPDYARWWLPDGETQLRPVVVDADPQPDTDQRLPTGVAEWRDPAVRQAYARAAAQFSDPAYLAALQTELEATFTETFSAWQAIHPNAEWPWANLARRQTMLRRTVSPAVPLRAVQVSSAPDRIAITAANQTGLPQAVTAVWVGDGTRMADIPLDPAVVIPVGEQTLIELPLTAVYAAEPTFSFTAPPELRLRSRPVGIDLPLADSPVQ